MRDRRDVMGVASCPEHAVVSCGIQPERGVLARLVRLGPRNKLPSHTTVDYAGDTSADMGHAPPAARHRTVTMLLADPVQVRDSDALSRVLNAKQ